MRKAVFIAGLILLAVSGRAAVVFLDTFEDRTVGAGAGGWNWGDNGTTHTATFQMFEGSIVRHQQGVLPTAGGSNLRFGSKWDITMNGNTSANPADYTIEMDLRNVSGGWDPIPLEIWVLTKPASGDDQGYGTPTLNISQADGWVHVKFNLAELTRTWWQGANWDMTRPQWSLEVGMPWPGQTAAQGWTQIFLIDNIKITMGNPIEAYDPVVLPDNGDGTVGTLLSQTQAEVTLAFKAGSDPNMARNYPVNPDILGHYIYVGPSSGTLQLLDYVPHVHNPDPYQTNPNVTYGPIVLNQGTQYNWQVEEALNRGDGQPYGAGDPNNIIGPVWTFKSISAVPTILVHPKNALALNGNASFSVTASVAATSYQWFKVSSPTDIQLTDDGKFSGTQTATLTITGATVADEGLYYCIAYNNGIPSEPSNTAKLWYPRLVGYYPFDTLTDNTSPDVISGLNAVMMQAGEAPLPGLNTADALIGTGCLQLSNPVSDSSDDQYAQLPAGVIDYEDLTISLWVRPNNVFTWSRILDFGAGTTDYLFITPNNGGNALRFAIRDDNGTEQMLTGPAVPVGQWSHIAFTLTGTTGRLYYNGELVAANTSMSFNPIDLAAAVNYLGKSQYTTDPDFDGLIDDLKIYNYARSTVEIAQEYLAVMGGSVCNREIYDMGMYDADGDCRISLPDFAAFAARWLEDDRIYPNP